MIRIDLLPPRQRERPTLAASSRGLRATAVSLLLCALVFGGLWWRTLDHRRSELERRIARDQRELLPLRDAAARADRAAVSNADLSKRLGAIDGLQAGRRAAVRLLTVLGRSLPDDAWLTDVSQRHDETRVSGRALSLEAVGDFAQRLQASGAFERPLEIVTTARESVGEMSLVRFVLRAGASAAGAPPQRRVPEAPRRRAD